MKVADVEFEVVALPHLDGEKVMIVPLSLMTRCILSKKHFGHILEVAERMCK